MLWKLLAAYLSNRAEVEPKQPLGPFHTDAAVYATEPRSGLRVTWFGHSSLLVELDGARVLIDPIWEQRASPLQRLGPKRFFPPTLPLDALPRLDAVLISHDHYDHLGAQTAAQLARLQPQAQWVTSLGVGALLRGSGVPAARITELDWTQSWQGPGALRVTAWPARHFSGRSLLHRFETLWSCFVLEGPHHRVFYGADSGPWEGFAAIARRYDGFDLTMLEIGAYHPLWGSIHLGPDNAAEAFEAMRPQAGSTDGVAHPSAHLTDGREEAGGLLMPIHWGLFNLALHAWNQPIERLLEIAAERGLRLWLPTPGEPTDVLPGSPAQSMWWRARPNA